MAVREIGADRNSCPTEWFVSVFERTALPSGGKWGARHERWPRRICQASANDLPNLRPAQHPFQSETEGAEIRCGQKFVADLFKEGRRSHRHKDLPPTLS